MRRRSRLALSLPTWRGAMTLLRSRCGTGLGRPLRAAGRWTARLCAGGISSRANSGRTFALPPPEIVIGVVTVRVPAGAEAAGVEAVLRWFGGPTP